MGKQQFNRSSSHDNRAKEVARSKNGISIHVLSLSKGKKMDGIFPGKITPLKFLEKEGLFPYEKNGEATFNIKVKQNPIYDFSSNSKSLKDEQKQRGIEYTEDLKSGNDTKDLESFVSLDHLEPILSVCKKGNYTISIRQTGLLSVKRLNQGAMAKPHKVLEKSIKDSSLRNSHKHMLMTEKGIDNFGIEGCAKFLEILLKEINTESKASFVKKFPEQWEQLKLSVAENSMLNAKKHLEQLKKMDVDGFVGHWDKMGKGELLGLRVDATMARTKLEGVAKCTKLNKDDYYVPLQNIELVKNLPNWERYFYTGDYDIHEIYHNKRQVMEASKEMVEIINLLNEAISNKEALKSKDYSHIAEEYLMNAKEHSMLAGKYQTIAMSYVDKVNEYADKSDKEYGAYSTKANEYTDLIISESEKTKMWFEEENKYRAKAEHDFMMANLYYTKEKDIYEHARRGSAILGENGIHMDEKSNYAMFQHGPQNNYKINQIMEANPIPASSLQTVEYMAPGRRCYNKPTLVTDINNESKEPLIWFTHQMRLYTTYNIQQHEKLRREELQVNKPDYWGKHIKKR